MHALHSLLSDVQNVLATAVQRIERHGGMLRQFIRDDKGAVIIWSFGLTHQAYVDSAQRGLDSALDVVAGLKALKVRQPNESGGGDDDDDDDDDGGDEDAGVAAGDAAGDDGGGGGGANSGGSGGANGSGGGGSGDGSGSVSGSGNKSDRPGSKKERWAATLRPVVGVTSGTAYCGLVGAKYRCEYCIMGVSHFEAMDIQQTGPVCVSL